MQLLIRLHLPYSTVHVYNFRSIGQEQNQRSIKEQITQPLLLYHVSIV